MPMSSQPGNQDRPDVKPLSSLPRLNPNPVIEIDPSGGVTFLSDGATRALESLGRNASPDVFLPQDMDEILAALKRRERAVFRREVRVGDRVFDESICIAPEHDAVGIYATDITERKLAETALLTQRNRAQDYLDVAGVMLVAMDTTGRVTLINRRGCEVLGWPDQEALGRNWFETFLPERTRTATRTVFRQLLAGEPVGPEYSETIVLTRSGEERLIAWHDRLLRDEAGNVTGILSSGEDVTERRRAEQELRRQTALLRALVESPPDIIIFALDRSYRYTTFNANHAREMKMVYGVDIGVGMNMLDIINIPEVRAKARQSLDRALAGESFTEVEVQPGLDIWYEFNWSPIHAPDGSVNGLTAFIHDITQRKRAETALMESEAKYRLVVETAGEAIAMVQDGKVVFANSHASEMSGYAREELLTRSFIDFILPEDRALVADRYRRRLTGKDAPGPYEARIVDRNGATHHLEINAVSMEWKGRPATLHFFADVTRRKQAEAALIESELKYRRVFETSNDAMMLLDSERFFDCNEATLRVFGCSTRDEFLGKHPAEVSPPVQLDGRQSRVAADENMAAALRDGRNYFEWLHRRADGSVFPADVLLTPLDFQGRTVLQATVRDISARKQADHALSESEERYRRLVADMGEGIGVGDADERFTFANRAAEELFGVPAGGLVGRSLLEFLDTGQAGFVHRQTARRRAGGTSSYELEITRPDGTKRTTLITSSPQYDTEGNYTGAFGIFHDITARRQAEQQARTERDKLRRILDAVPDGAYVVGQDYELQYLNPALLARGGPVNSRKCFDYFHGRAEPCPGCANPHVFAGAATRREYTTRQGGVTYDIQDVPITGDDGRPARLVFMRDITARKRAEAELAKHREHLEELVRDRTAELEAANRELEAFSYSVSHDLRAPLRAIDGFTQILLDDCGPQLDAAARGHLGAVSAGARQMAELIDDLLSLARIARLPLERRPVDLSELARTIAGELRGAEPARQIELVVQNGMTAPADPVLTAMVLRNLLGNAWKFTSRHTTARIEFGETRVNGERVWFVRDDGAGFEMAYVSQLFAPFRRLHTEHDFPGSGIGLAIVRRIVQRHGGRAWIEAEVEKGATCRFTLEPASKEAQGA